jgi:hypothetical protein
MEFFFLLEESSTGIADLKINIQESRYWRMPENRGSGTPTIPVYPNKSSHAPFCCLVTKKPAHLHEPV